MSSWPPGTRLIVCARKDPPRNSTTVYRLQRGWVTAFITDTGHGLVCGQLGGLSSKTLILFWLGRLRVLASWVRNPSTSTRNRFVVAYRGLAGAVAGSCVARLLVTACAAVSVYLRASRQPCRPGIAAAQGGNG